jgi:AAA+ ATPase superfamily predicted ATPase
MKFINRIRELAFLEQEYSLERSSFVVVYGRRRLGKTELIKEFIKDKQQTVYFLADKSSESIAINLFKDVITRSLGKQFLTDVSFSTWDQLFQYYLQELDFSVKQILVIDEFHYLVWANPSFPSILQRIWDEYLKERNIMLILCGSSVSMMLSEVLNYDSPLYGRRTGQIQIEPLTFLSFREFYPDSDNISLVELYGITGGVPKYMEFFNSREPLISQIRESYLNVDHFLNQEARFILSEEINEPINYFSILKSIAGGNHTIAGISNDLKFPLQKITPYLHTLQQIGLVERIVPVTETAPHKSKKGLYQIRDHYLRFWFRYIFPYLSDIAMGHTDWLLEKIRKEYSDYMAPVFEEISRQLIPSIYPGKYTRIGSWWDKRNEVDIVCLNPETQLVLAGECKWTEKLVGIEALSKLKEYTKVINFGFQPAGIRFIIFSKNGFTKELLRLQDENCLLINQSGMHSIR